MEDDHSHSLTYRPPPRAKHPLLDEQSFEQLHRNGVIETKPHTMHFGGFQIHQDHSNLLRVINTSSSSLRIIVIGPSTPYFRIRFDKKGCLAPGMAEEILVTFTPHEWRYYYDSVKISCGALGENLVVPIHGYPSTNDISLPRLVDFGAVAIGSTRTKVIPLTCKIPINFEFRIDLVQTHPAFEVTPLEGIIPAHGETNVVITFLPTRHATCRLELQFHISQYDFEPVTVSIVGSSAPDVLKREIIAAEDMELQEQQAMLEQDAMKVKVEALKQKKGRGPLQVKKFSPPPEETTRVVDGVKVPTRTGSQMTAYVLNQTNGRLLLKDMMALIQDQRKTAEERRLKAAKGLQEVGFDVDMEGMETGDLQALELRWETMYREVETADKDRELKTKMALGDSELTEAEVEEQVQARLRKHADALQAMKDADLLRMEPEVNDYPVRVPTSFVPAQQPTWDTNRNDTYAVRLQVLDRFQCAGACYLKRMRARQNVEKLRKALHAAKVVDKDTCKAWVEAENKQAVAGGMGALSEEEPSGEGGGSVATSANQFGGMGSAFEAVGAAASPQEASAPQGKPQTQDQIGIPPDFVLPFQWPTKGSSLTMGERLPVKVDDLGSFQVFRPVEVKPRLDWKVFQYDKFPTPPRSAYMKLRDGKPSLRAALDDMLIRGPRGLATDGCEEPLDMPDSCLLPPVPRRGDALSLLVPSPDVRTYVAGPDYVETDHEYKLAQEPPDIEEPKFSEFIPEDILSLQRPWIDCWRRRRQIQDPFMHWDPFPASFVEGGGNRNSFLGGDLGGERFSFLPVGGFARDIPSDTDTDNPEELQHELPSAELFQATMDDLSKPFTSELWQKLEEREKWLSDTMAERNKAQRERLAELNKYITHRHDVLPLA